MVDNWSGISYDKKTIRAQQVKVRNVLVGGNSMDLNLSDNTNNYSPKNSWLKSPVPMKKNVILGQKGQELVEFAVMLPFLLIVLIGVIDLGRVFHASITIANASRTGARYAISYGYEDVGGVVTINSAAVTTRAETEAQNSGITLDLVTVNCPGGCAHGGPVVVTTTHNFNFLFNAFIGSGINLSHSAEMKIPW